ARWVQIPKNHRRVIPGGLSGSIPDTPKRKSRVFQRVYKVIVGNNRASCLASASFLTRAGYKTQVPSIRISGEAREVGRIFGSIARDIRDNGLPYQAPASFVGGGATNDKVRGRGGGGGNQTVALAAAVKIRGSEGIVVGSFATDGIE